MSEFSANTSQAVKTISLAGALMVSSVGIVTAEDLRGGVRGFFTSFFESAVNIDGEDFTEVQVLSLPRESYIANASAVFAATGQPIRLVECLFTLDGVNVTELARGQFGGDFNNFLTLPLTFGFTIETMQDLGVACRSGGPGVVSQPTSLAAIRVNRLEVQ